MSKLNCKCFEINERISQPVNVSFGLVQAINPSPNNCISPMKGIASLLDLDPFERGPNQAQVAKRDRPDCPILATSLDELVGSTIPDVGHTNANRKGVPMKKKNSVVGFHRLLML